jgi:hypothetical protein
VIFFAGRTKSSNQNCRVTANGTEFSYFVPTSTFLNAASQPKYQGEQKPEENCDNWWRDFRFKFRYRKRWLEMED